MLQIYTWFSGGSLSKNQFGSVLESCVWSGYKLTDEENDILWHPLLEYNLGSKTNEGVNLILDVLRKEVMC